MAKNNQIELKPNFLQISDQLNKAKTALIRLEEAIKDLEKLGFAIELKLDGSDFRLKVF